MQCDLGKFPLGAGKEKLRQGNLLSSLKRRAWDSILGVGRDKFLKAVIGWVAPREEQPKQAVHRVQERSNANLSRQSQRSGQAILPRSSRGDARKKLLTTIPESSQPSSFFESRAHVGTSLLNALARRKISVQERFSAATRDYPISGQGRLKKD